MIIEQMEHKNIVLNNIANDINPEIIQGSIQAAAAVIPRGDVAFIYGPGQSRSTCHPSTASTRHVLGVLLTRG